MVFNCLFARKKDKEIESDSDGDLEVYNGNGGTLYTYQPGIYGQYQLQSYKINGRVYFKKGIFGIWWNGCDKWLIGYHRHRGQKLGFVFFKNDVLYPHQILNWNAGKLATRKGTLKDAENSVAIRCKYKNVNLDE